MNVLSLFDGMSCGQIALNRAGIKYDNYYASEVDKHAIKVAMSNYPNTIQLGDVTKIDPSSLPKIDLLIGGSPCQGFSYAGKQLNFNDERSKLFFEYVRVKNQCEPKFFLLENVPMQQQFISVISRYLGIDPITLNANRVSAQNRERLFWTNINVKPVGLFDIPMCCIPKPDDRRIFIRDIIEQKPYKRRKIKHLQTVRMRKNYAQFDNSLKGHDSQNCRYYYLNGKVGTLAKSSSTIPMIESEKKDECLIMDVSFGERLQGVPVGYTKHVSNSEAFKMLGNGWNVDIIAHIFSYLALTQ